MPLAKTAALVLRTTDFRETSRVVIFWTREFGKVHALAKGGRRLRSAFESALDLLNLCDIVLVRKTSDALDLLTEARLRESFANLRGQLPAYYAACLIAEILSICAQENDPHPTWFDLTITSLRQLGNGGVYPELLRWEACALREVGLRPALERCALCKLPFTELPTDQAVTWSALAGGLVCPRCPVAARGKRQLSPKFFRHLQTLFATPSQSPPATICLELLDVLHDYWMHQLGQQLRLAVYFQPIHPNAGQAERGHGTELLDSH